MKIETYVTGPIQVNTYVIKDESSKEAIIIDVGGNFKQIKNEIEKSGYKLKCILCTHGHFDHVLGLAQENVEEIPIYINEKDKVHYENIVQTLTVWGFAAQNLSFKPTHFITDSTNITLGNTEIKILNTPGHSKGSVSYYINGNLFSGDALFAESIGRTDFVDGDYEELIKSIKSQLLVLPEETKVYPGHGPATTIKSEKKNNPYLT